MTEIGQEGDDGGAGRKEVKIDDGPAGWKEKGRRTNRHTDKKGKGVPKRI